MKKQLAGILSTVLIFSFGTIQAFAAGHGSGCHYYDANNDGVCDYACSSCVFVDQDGDGICDNCGIGSDGTCHGVYYTDVDNDGICDNYANNTCPGRGQGYGCHGGRNRHGR